MLRRDIRLACAVFLALALSGCATRDLSPPRQDQHREIVLSGDLTRTDHQTYRELPFNVPQGVTRITIELSYDHDQHTVIDLGLRDPAGQRGWSGGNKSCIVIGVDDATPSYRAGPILPGVWTLVLGVPNIREGVRAHFTATVTLDGDHSWRPPSAFLDAPVSLEPGWRRGDFHMHTGHSDASCDNDDGKRIPCPVIRTLEAAKHAGLDFIAITDHNTLTQAEVMRELQPAFPHLLLIPGEEITTFHGHANALGLSSPVDFQLGSKRLPALGKLLDEVDAQGGLLSINHPGQPSGEDCMGCGWTVADTDYARIAAIEAVNGGSVRAGKTEGPTSGIAFWEARLDAGFHITAIGGSDNHDATDWTGRRQSPVGVPTTVVWTQDLSQRGVLAGVRSGRVFVDLAPDPAHRLEVTATAGAQNVTMGGELELGPGEKAQFDATASGAPGSRIEIVSHGLSLLDGGGTATGSATFQLEPNAPNGWIRANVRNADGRLIMLGNPVYVRLR
ncbi:MAG: PHP domain-containing protein [Alphaproteobacteria bacterium]|nr:PHP domain-containing protein [Alphaproteobacteria bacterium]